MPVIELVEEEYSEFDRGALDEATAVALHKHSSFDVDFPSVVNEYKYRIKSKGLVGHLPIASDTLVRITPKVPVANLFRMLEYAYKLPSLKLLDGVTGVESLEDLFERVVMILSKRVLDRTRKGLYRAYVEEHEDLGFVRGRVDIRRNMRGVLCARPVIHCEYQELTEDLEDNQILLWALYVGSRLPLQREEVRQHVRRAYRALAGAISFTDKGAAACVGRYYHRLNEDYRASHGLCRFLLEQSGPNVKAGEHQTVPFTLNMPKLFESFVAEWLSANAPFTVDPHYQAKLTEDGKLLFDIDIVLRDPETDETIAVIDTKYKRHEHPDESDIQQVVAYSVKVETDKAFLIYPTANIHSREIPVGRHQRVWNLAFDTNIDPEWAGKRFLSNLHGALESTHF